MFERIDVVKDLEMITLKFVNIKEFVLTVNLSVFI